MAQLLRAMERFTEVGLPTEAPGIQGAKVGAGTRTRTEDLLITNQLLYQLSYAGQA